ncbi:MAG: SPOR domain-containing protein [Neisseria sp.]
MNAKKKQYGQGIGGFIFGLLLATAIIGGILYFLNNTKAEYKEIPQSQELPKPEILVPSSAGSAVASAVSDDSASVEFVDADELAASDIDDASKPIQSGAVTSPTQPVTKEVQAEQQRLAEEKQRVKQARQKQEAIQKEREAEAQKKAQLKKEQAAEQQKKTESAKPTPEQILNHGNLEKAQKEATESAKTKKETSKKETSKKETSKKEAAEKQTASSRSIVQMGSYNNEKAADTQRAKLAMIGVSANVVEATANGQTVYRVQSARLSADAAEDMRKTLQQNGVNSFTRSVN